jgi:hypothetical protein
MTLITLAGMAAVMWMEAPEWQRETAKRAVKAKSRRLADALARRSGHRAMGDELSGRAPAAESGYRFTYRLSKLRDAL